MRLNLGKKKAGIDYFGRFLNNCLAISLDTTAVSRPLYFGLTLGTLLNKNLEIEFEFNKRPHTLFYIYGGWTIHQDHCGPSLNITILNMEFSIQVYDSRHWSYEKKRFHLPGEEMCEYEARKRQVHPPRLDQINKEIEALEDERERLLESNKLGDC